MPLSIIAIASDDGSGVDNATLWYRYSSDNLIWQPWIKSNTDNREPWSWLFDAPCGDGYYEFYSIAVDVAGNFEQPPEDADTTCGVDTTPPVSSVDSIFPYWRKSTHFTITTTTSDSIPSSGAVPSGLKQVELLYRYSTDNTTWGEWASYSVDNEEPWTWSFSAPYGDGYYGFFTVATDIALNAENEPSKPDTYVGVDTLAPVSSVDSIAPYWQNAGMVPFKITATASDPIPSSEAIPSGLKQAELFYRYSTDNSTWDEWASYGINNAAPWSWSFDAPERDGYYEFYTLATDIALNVEAAPERADLNLGVDTTPPVSSVDQIEPYWQETVPFEVSVKALDALSGVAGVELYFRSSIDNVSWTGWKLFNVDNVTLHEWSFVAPDGYALYEFYSVATDAALNVEKTPEVADASCGAVIPATIDIDPDTLNLKSQGRWITAYIEFPADYDLENIIISTIGLESVVPAELHPAEIGDHDGDGILDLMVKFDRSRVQTLLEPGDEVDLTITGIWHAVRFKGTDTIRMIDRGQGQENGHGRDHGNRPEVPPGQSGEHSNNNPEQPPGQSNQGNQGQGNQGGNGGSGQGQGNGNQGKGKG